MKLSSYRSVTPLPLVKYLLIGTLCLFTSLANAQNLQEGISFYQEGQYNQAVEIFKQLGTSEAHLYAGKSYFSLGRYVKAKTYLERISDSAPKEIKLEARYTSALADFQLKQFGQALSRLESFHEESVKTQLVTEGIRLYRDILDYLTLNQRKEVYQSSSSSRIRYDVIRTAMGKVGYSTASLLINNYRKTAGLDSSSLQLQELESMVSDSLNYAMQVAFGEELQAPQGMTYNIGAALPSYKTEDPNFATSQGLYFGYLLAAEEYNQQHNDKKVFIRYQDTGASPDSSEHLMTDFAWNYSIDAVLGPLFSEPAVKIAELAEQYQIPVLAPLANSDTLNVDNPYVYQANPTLAHMARGWLNMLSIPYRWIL